jgi:outer membrane protein TolC
MRDMKTRSNWAWMPIVCLLLFGLTPGRGIAQSSAPPSQVPSTGVPAIARGSRPTDPAVAPAVNRGTAILAQLPSTPEPSFPPATGPGRQTSPNPLATTPNLKASLEPTDVRLPINLATALKLSDARPLVVAAAQAGVWIAEAELTRAKVLWIPTLNIGFDYIRHDGGGPDFNKGIMTAPSTNLFYGGIGATGNLPIVDAIYNPLAARQVLSSHHWDVQSAKNDALHRTADAYFLVHQYRGIFASYLYTVGRGQELVGRIRNLSKDLVPTVEIERARNLLADLEQRAVLARQEWRVQSANLTQVLRLDPRAVIEPLEHDHTQVTLIDPAKPLDELMVLALTNRPELESRQALVQAAVAQIRREKARPFVPNILLNGFQTPNELIQAGLFGLGPNSSLNQWVGRDDFSIQPMWQLEAFGIGNMARIKQQRGIESMAIVEFLKEQDTVAGDVTRAQARVQSAAVRVLQADRALRTGIITFNGNYEGLKETTRFGEVLVLVNRPQEAVFALQLLATSFEEYFTTVSEYNRAQFELFHALGYPAQELAVSRPPGDVLPTDTSRPSYLPPVGTGPPPATR